MDINEFYEKLTEYSLDSENYNKWREIHSRAFGSIFTNAFSDIPEAQIHLTAALINVSQRRFEDAMPKLNILKEFCYNDYDEAALNYFIGLNYEFLGDETQMTNYYDALLNSNFDFLYGLSFHPYYRTAKFAQRDSECGKAIYYYKKALEFYDNAEIDSLKAKTISFIYYDLSTVYLYCHNYDLSESYMDLSFRYDSNANSNRTYVLAILYALQGEVDKMNSLLDSLSQMLRDYCETMTSAIIKSADLHYFAVPQDDASHSEFWEKFSSNKGTIFQLVEEENYKDAEKIVAELITDTFYGFMKRKLECRIEKDDCQVVFKCKNYCVKTLKAELEKLFLNNVFSDCKFVSVDEFENYSK